MPRAFIFGKVHHLVDLNQVCLNYGPGAKSGPVLGVTCFTYNMKMVVRVTTLVAVVVFDLPVVIFLMC